MDDIQSVGNGEYNCADEIEEWSAFKQITITVAAVIGILPHVIVALVLIGYSVLKHAFHLVFPEPLRSIRGQLAVVTGGGNGIGREICLQLATEGCNVAVLDMDFGAAERTCHDVRQLGVNAMPYKIDVSDYGQVVAVKELIDRDMGATDILVNNAGLMPKVSLLDATPQDIDRIIKVNVSSHFYTCRVFMADMIARGRGHIVAIASMIAFYPCERAIAYTTTKFAVKGFMEALNQEIREDGHNIKTLTVFPFFVNTRKEMIDYVRQTMGADLLRKMGLRSAKDVGFVTVNGIRSGSKYVSVPWYYLGLGKFFLSLPTSWQDIIIRILIPKALSPPRTKSN